MATRPSTAPMFPRLDQTAGDPSLIPENPIILDNGANQFLGHHANHHDDSGAKIWVEQSNVLAVDNYVGWRSDVDKPANAINPAGVQRPHTLEGGSDNPRP
jgi:hypothetical protein